MRKAEVTFRLSVTVASIKAVIGLAHRSPQWPWPWFVRLEEYACCRRLGKRSGIIVSNQQHGAGPRLVRIERHSERSDLSAKHPTDFRVEHLNFGAVGKRPTRRGRHRGQSTYCREGSRWWQRTYGSFALADTSRLLARPQGDPHNRPCYSSCPTTTRCEAPYARSVLAQKGRLETAGIGGRVRD